MRDSCTPAQIRSLDRGLPAPELNIRHSITNNPNDQIRPEDLENELATGCKPSYRVAVANPEDWDSEGWDGTFTWRADRNDYSGDGIKLPSYLWLDEAGEVVLVENGSSISAPVGYPTDSPLSDEDIVFIVKADSSGQPIPDADGNPQLLTITNESGEEVKAVGLRNKEVVEDEDGNEVIQAIGTTFRDTLLADEEGISSDIRNGLTWEWFTTMDRDPFESYYDDDGEEISGPRWRLKANKFGQDVPGMEIPLIPGSQPPFRSDNIKYEVGAETVTTINLLDGAGLLDSGLDLRNSNHWVFPLDEDERDPDGDTISENGLPLTNGFDFSIYIKGDRKPAALYDVQLVLSYELAEGAVGYDYGDVLVSYEGDPVDPARAEVLVDESGTPVYYLGTPEQVGIDAETGPISTVDASGDDNVNLDDENGITFRSSVIPGMDTRLEIATSLQNADGTVNEDGGYLYAWLDSNQDGVFDPVTERVQFRGADDLLVDELAIADGGLANVQMIVPIDATPGNSFMRFRLSPVGPDEGVDILPTGVIGGEGNAFGEDGFRCSLMLSDDDGSASVNRGGFLVAALNT